MIYFFKFFFTELIIGVRANRIGYYTDIDYLPIFNWFKIMEGKLEFLYKKQKTTKIPCFFKNLPLELLLQFDKLDTTFFENNHQLAYIRALYYLTKDPKYLNKFRSIMYNVENAAKTNNETININDMLNFIEENTNSIGQIDVHKMSTRRFFSLYYRTLEKIKKNGDIRT